MVCKKQLDHEVEKVVQSDPWEQWRGFVDVDDEDRRSFSDESECILKKIESFPVKRLRFARNTILDAADEMVVGAFDAYAYPCEALGFLEVKTDELDIDQKGYVRNEWSYFLLEDILDRQVFETMRNIAVTGAHPKAVRKLKELAPSLIRILLAARKLLGKKMELATKLGLNETAQKLGKACEEFCMIELTGDIDTDAKRLFLERKITPDEFRVAMRRAFMLDRQATKEINSWKSTEHCNFKSSLSLLDEANLRQELKPSESKKDAREFMARLICYVWCMFPECKSKNKATNYVFFDAKEGSRMFDECSNARRLLEQYSYNPNYIRTEAAKLHSKLVTFRKSSGMEWPENWREMVRKSKKRESGCKKDA